MAFARPGKIQHGAVGRLPLLLQTEVVVPRATTIPAVLPLRRPRQPDVDLRATKSRVTTHRSKRRLGHGPGAKLPRPQESLVEDAEPRNFTTPIQWTIDRQPIER